MKKMSRRAKHFTFVFFICIISTKRLTATLTGHTGVSIAPNVRHNHQSGAITRSRTFDSGHVTRQQLTSSRFMAIDENSFISSFRNISRFKRLPEAPTTQNDETVYSSLELNSRLVRREEMMDRKKRRLRHAPTPTGMSADSHPDIPESSSSTEYSFVGSIHKDTLRRMLNESFSIAGPTPNSGKISATDPYIDPATPYRVNAYYGNTTVLPCFVNNLGQHSVSWVRHQDIHVLTVGQFTFTNDGRFHSHHEDGSNEWALRLSSPNMNDTGFYECQVNTKPILVRLIFLKVYEPKAVISGGEELYLKLGSTIALKCVVTESSGPSGFLLWYHNKNVVGYGDKRTEITISHDGNQTISVLKITSATIRDSGKYSCSPSNAQDASVKVHVINGEHPAAMQTNGGASRTQLQNLFWYFHWTSLLAILTSYHSDCCFNIAPPHCLLS